MCGRFTLTSNLDDLQGRFDFQALDLDYRPAYNIAPTQQVLTVTNDGQRRAEFMRWGLVPFWAKDSSIGNRMINARAETVAEKPSFRAAYRKRRCLVLADGFYEWRKEPSGKKPYYISLASGAPFAFAGLWEDWHAKDSDESVQSATIITTAANKFMSNLHDRMPVVLEKDAGDRWLNGDEQVLSEATELIPRFRAWPVDRRVNNTSNEGAELVEPVGEALSG